MKTMLTLLGAGLLAATFAVAQDAPATSSESSEAAQTNQTTQTYQTSNGVIRGCLSGSAGNYTITDQNGTQYTVSGPETQLQASVGHEVELSTRQDQSSQSSAQSGQTTSSTTNTVQASSIRDISSTCTAGHSMSTSPMNNDDQANPKGTPDAAEPPQPQQMAMLQQQESKPDVGTNNPQQTTPPVSSQTPATPGASTSSTQQSATQGAAGTEATPSTSSTTTSTTSTTTTTNQPANTQSGATPDNNQGMNNSATPQANTNDQNKPLYERQATDIPWANHSGNNSANTGNTNTGNPNSGTSSNSGSSNPPQ